MVLMAQTKNQTPDNLIYVGSKHLMNYVGAVSMLINTKKHKEIIICARGKFISKAIDIIEILKNKYFVDQITISEIKTSTQSSTRKEDDKKFNISIIEIHIKIN